MKSVKRYASINFIKSLKKLASLKLIIHMLFINQVHKSTNRLYNEKIRVRRTHD